MPLRFEAPLRLRLHRYFVGVTLVKPTDDNLWWNCTHKTWETYHKHKDCAYSTHAPCKTLRAFKRMLRKYPQIVGKAVLVNRYSGSGFGCDVYSECDTIV